MSSGGAGKKEAGSHGSGAASGVLHSPMKKYQGGVTTTPTKPLLEFVKLSDMFLDKVRQGTPLSTVAGALKEHPQVKKPSDFRVS